MRRRATLRGRQSHMRNLPGGARADLAPLVPRMRKTVPLGIHPLLFPGPPLRRVPHGRRVSMGPAPWAPTMAPFVNLVHLIKYHGYTSLAAELGVELSQRARQEFPGAADAGDGLITFVPIARKPGKSAASIRPGFSPRAPPGAWEWHSRPLSRGEPPRPPRHA